MIVQVAAGRVRCAERCKRQLQGFFGSSLADTARDSDDLSIAACARSPAKIIQRCERILNES